MRLGIDCRMYSSKFTGIGRYTHEIVSEIIKLNQKLSHPHEIVLFFNNPEYSIFKKHPFTKKILVNARHYSLAEQTSFLKKLLNEKLDLTFFPHFNVPLLYNRPYIITIHDLTLTLFPGRKMTRFYHRLGYNLIIRNAVKKAQKIIAVSKNTKHDLIRYLKVPSNKISVIHNGISEIFKPLYKSDRQTTSLHKTLKKFKINKNFLLYTGVWRSHKNLPNLIKAFALINKKNSNLLLVITGHTDPLYPEIKETVQKLKLQKSVIFTGFVNETELLHLYNAAKIFVFPSLYEGFGLPLLEAMSCETPVIAAGTSSIPEICGKKNAIFFNPHDLKDIADKIDLLYKNKALCGKLGKKGLIHSRKFSWKKTGAETFKIIVAYITSHV